MQVPDLVGRQFGKLSCLSTSAARRFMAGPVRCSIAPVPVAGRRSSPRLI